MHNAQKLIWLQGILTWKTITCLRLEMFKSYLACQIVLVHVTLEHFFIKYKNNDSTLK